MTTANHDDDSTATCPPNPYEPPVAALDAPAGAPAVFRSYTWLYWIPAVGLGAVAACALLIGLMFLLWAATLDPSEKVTVSPPWVGMLQIVAEGLVSLALAVLLVRQAIAHREPLIRPCREGLVVRAVSWSGRVTTFDIPWPELVSAEARGIPGFKQLVVLTRVEPYEIRFFGGDCVFRPRAVAAAIVALARDEATHVALPGWDRPPVS